MRCGPIIRKKRDKPKTERSGNLPKVYNRKTDVLPTTARYVGRGSPFGNPFIMGPHGTREEVIQKFTDWVEKNALLRKRIKKELVGCDLVCNCAPEPCHGDILLKIANS